MSILKILFQLLINAIGPELNLGHHFQLVLIAETEFVKMLKVYVDVLKIVSKKHNLILILFKISVMMDINNIVIACPREWN